MKYIQKADARDGPYSSGKRQAILPAVIIASLVLTVLLVYQSARIEKFESEENAVITRQQDQIAQYSSLIDSQIDVLADRQSQIESLERLISEANTSLRNLKESNNSQQILISDQKDQIDSLNSILNERNSRLSQFESQSKTLEESLVAANSELESNKKIVSELNKKVQSQSNAGRLKLSHYGLGVTDQNKGVVFPIDVEIIKPGDGVISVDIGNAQYESTFQGAVRTAASVAANYAQIPITDKDIVIRLASKKSGPIVNIDGPSAGALMTGMIIAGLSEKSLNPTVLITGAIGTDGSVSSVGGLQPKTEAAADFGASKVLVPKGQEFNSNRVDVVGISDIKGVIEHLVKD